MPRPAIMKMVSVVLLAFLAWPCYAGKLAGPRYTASSFVHSGFQVYPTEFYFYGVVDATRGKTWCAPKAMGMDEMRDTVLVKLRELPEDRLSQSGGAVLVEALEQTFPCGKGETGEAVPEVTGAQLMEYLPSGEDSLGRRVNDYVYGVSDSTRGKAWCLRRIIKPTDVNSEVYSFIRKLPQERLRENAATLVMEALYQLAPCKSTRSHIRN